MKKAVYLLLVLGASLLNLGAQEFHFIPKAGVNITNMTNAGDALGGLNIGASAEILFTDMFAFEPGLYFSMQGSDFDSEVGSHAKLITNYINIPLLAKVYVYEGLHVYGGPQVGINVSSKIKLKERGVSASVDADDLINTMNLDLVFGIGYLFDMGLSLSFNYNVGLTNALDQDYSVNGISAKGEKSRHMVAQFNVGWRF